jgi:hypothetical protein
VLKDQSGQTLPIVAFALIGLLAMGGLVVDTSRLYYCHTELQASADAAALAGADFLPNTTATSEATTYSAVAGNLNAQSSLPGVTMVTGYPKLLCVESLVLEGMTCLAPTNDNAIQVRQQVTVPTYFMSIFGHSSFTLTATASASMRGAPAGPYNVAIIVDTTDSMTQTDGDSQCKGTRLACSLAGVQILLNDMSPCISSDSTCTVTNGNAANSVDRVSLFTFPNMTVGTAPVDYCGTTSPKGSSLSIPLYSLPSATATTYAPSGSTTATYQVINYSSDYRTSDTATSLYSKSDLALAAGSQSGCAGMQVKGGDGTYYAGVIYAAQSSLVAEQLANPGSQNVIILISDGDATATKAKMASTATGNGLYPSYTQECAQAVTAAAAATTAGTRVYAVAYGTQSSGCQYDTNPTITPCATMENIASHKPGVPSPYFYSDYTQGGTTGTCISAAQPTSNMNQIFTDIAMDFTFARLIPDSAFF